MALGVWPLLRYVMIPPTPLVPFMYSSLLHKHHSRSRLTYSFTHQALVKARKHERKFPSIFENVRGIILFGPPYSSPHLYSLLPRPSKLSNSEPKVTRWLGLQASIVNQYAEDFALVSSDIRIVAFHEAMLARPSTVRS